MERVIALKLMETFWKVPKFFSRAVLLVVVDRQKTAWSIERPFQTDTEWSLHAGAVMFKPSKNTGRFRYLNTLAD